MSFRRLIGSDGRGGGGSSGGCSYRDVGGKGSGGLLASEYIFKSEFLFLGRL